MSDNKMKFSDRMSFVSLNKSNVIINDGSIGTGGADNVPVSEEDKIEARLEEAYRNGWSECEKATQTTILSLNQQIQQLASDIPTAINAYFQELENQMKEEVGKLAFSIAEMILRKELDKSCYTKDVVEEALSPLLSLEGVKLRLNPDIAAKASTGEFSAAAATVEVVSDPTLMPGEAIVEGRQGYIDATLEGRLQALREAFGKEISEQRQG